MTESEKPPRRVPDPDRIDGMDKLQSRMEDADTIEDWSHILKDYLSFGNAMLNDNIAIFNVGTATDCPNIGTEHCQVPKNDCYAFRDEKLYPNVLAYRRRQEYLWDALDPETFAHAFLELCSRKRKNVDILRFNESGDLRHESDVIRMERVAEILAEHDMAVYTYTASDYVDLSETDHLTINASNDWVEGADQRFRTVDVEEGEEIPEDGFHCPASDPEQDITCGNCVACMHDGGDDEIYVILRKS